MLPLRLALNEAALTKSREIVFQMLLERTGRGGLLAKYRSNFWHFPTTNGEDCIGAAVSSDLEWVPMHTGSLRGVLGFPSALLMCCMVPRQKLDTTQVRRC